MQFDLEFCHGNTTSAIGPLLPMPWRRRGYRTVLAAVGFVALGFGALPSSALAKPTVTTRYTYYTISGDTAAEIYGAIIRQGPRVRGVKSYATTTTTSSQDGRLVQGRSCQIKNYSFQLDFVTKLPRIANKKALPAADLTRWKEFSQFVKDHEATHRAIWIDCAATIERQTRAIRATNCGDFNKKVERIWQSVRASCLKRHDAFELSEQPRLMQHPFVKLVYRRGAKSHAGLLN